MEMPSDGFSITQPKNNDAKTALDKPNEAVKTFSLPSLFLLVPAYTKHQQRFASQSSFTLCSNT